jgi:PAS domain S-box-containing protein
MIFTEKRTAPRLRHQAGLSFARYGNSCYRKAMVYNYSEGGLYMETSMAFLVGDRLHLRMDRHTPQSQGPEAFRGYTAEVKSCRMRYGGKAPRYGIGVAFVATMNTDFIQPLQTSILPATPDSEYIQSIIDTIRDPLLLLDDNLRVVFASRSFYRTFKVTREDTEGQLIYDLGNRQWNIPRLKTLLERILPQNHVFNDYEIEHDFESIGKRIMLLNARRLRREKNSPPLLLLAIEDVTERINAERAVVEMSKRIKIEHQKLDLTLKAIGDGVITTDATGRITFMNKVAEKISKWNLPDAIGRPLDEVFYIINEATREPCKNPFIKISESGQVVGLANHTILIGKNGKEVAIADSGAPIFDADDQLIGAIIVFRDVTEEQLLEKKLQQAQKMEAIGTLAGGIAHDFNNILSAIIGYTELSLEDVEKGSIIEEKLQEVFMAGIRAKDLIAQILSFARRSKDVVAPIQINGIIKEVLNMIRSTIPTTIEIKEDINSSSMILGNITHIHQIIVNLCTNAAWAMQDEGGTLEVSLNDVNINSMSEMAKAGLEPGDYLSITVSDTGVGIEPHIINLIFDPYFTTKPIGEGSGMGLAVVHGLVKSYHGKITVNSEPRKGTGFTIHFPITKSDQILQPYGPEHLPSGTEKLLLVDDEAAIANIYGLSLKRLGYRVTTRTSAVEALDLFRAKPKDFDLVITDMTMPVMTGEVLAAELMAIRPEIPVIVSTGYSKRISESQARQNGIKALVIKPIIKAELAKTVRRVLDEAKDFF